MKQKENQLTYTLILHQIRKKLKLTLMEYCIADCIYHLSNNPKSEVKGWCYAAKERIAGMLGTTSKTIFENIKKLIEKNFIEKDEETHHLRTTAKWYESVVMIKANAEYNDTLHTITKGDTGLSRKVILGYNETSHNIDSSISITNKDTKLTTTGNDCVAGKEINNLIELFKEINPSYEKFFSNNTQRKALERLYAKLGEQKLVGVIKSLAKSNTIKYAPTISSPLQLEDKLANLIAFWQKQKTSQSVAII